MSVLVDNVANKTIRWPGEEVKKTEHGCLPATASLTELGEVLEIVSTEDRVDSEFAIK
jgi:hypothetical protein